jgi:hypothetical protein
MRCVGGQTCRDDSDARGLSWNLARVRVAVRAALLRADDGRHDAAMQMPWRKSKQEQLNLLDTESEPSTSEQEAALCRTGVPVDIKPPCAFPPDWEVMIDHM